MMLTGVALVVFGVVGWVLSGSDEEGSPEAPLAVATTVTTTTPVTDDSVATLDDFELDLTPTSTTTPPVTDGSAPTPTSTPVLEETIEEFVGAFAAATEADDFEFVWSRMHPAVIERADGDEALCRAWVEREILALSDYQLLDVIDGPAPLGEIPDVFTAAISFTFEGESFDGLGQYAVVDGRFTWLGLCR